MRPFVFTLILLGTLYYGSAQSWQEMMQDPNVNFYDVQREFNKYYAKQKKKQQRMVRRGQAHEERVPGYAMYKRWEWFMEQRVYPSGDRNQLLQASFENWNFLQNYRLNPSVMQSGNWNLLGPVNTIPNGGGCGRLNVVRIDPTNANVIYVGAPAGGMWKSTNGGLSWNTTTDNLASIGVSEVIVDYSNPNIVYIGTGDNDAGDTYSIGVLKSLDGGQTWNVTGLSFNTTQSARVTKMLIHPTNPQILYAGTNTGVFKTVDGGTNWFKLFTGGVKDLEFKPGDPNVIYMSTATSFYKSSNGGINFYLVSGGLPGSGSTSRLAIAVTPANPNYVYVLASRNSNNGFLGLYRSTNSGNSFGIESNSPNLLGWDPSGGDTDGQGWYTLSIDASPTDAEEIIVGGVNIWRSTDGGQNWTLNAHWYGGGGAPYVHADIHDLRYVNGTSYYVASDGGLAFTNNSGGTFTDLSAGLQIAQMYRLGTSATNPNLTITGWQDNGTNLWTSGSWSEIYGGDGMECFIDRTNAQVMYAESQYGNFGVSFDGGNSFTNIAGFSSEPAAWITPWCQDPQVANTIYAGLNNVWKSTDQGSTWNPISNFGPVGLTILQVAPSNNQIIWAGSQNVLYKTTNGGTTWTTVTIPFMAFLNSVAIDATNPNNVWVCFGGLFPGQKVYRTTDGGSTWTNISTSLPNVNCNTIVNQTGSNGGVYVGTDVGVFYYDNNIQTFVYFSNGLPNVIVDELEIQYSSGKLRAATYGRGLWETSLYNPASTAPLANFTANDLAGCPGFTVQFTDLSTNSPTSWNWTFPGGTPSSSTLQNPVVTYNNPGTYNDVKLVATNGNGSDSVTRYSYIAVSMITVPTVMLTNDDTICDNEPLLLIASTGANYLWSPTNQVTHMVSPAVSDTFSVTVTDIFGCSATSLPVAITILPFPSAVITQNGDTFCTSTTGVTYQWYLNGNPVNGATQACHVVTAPGNYYVVVTDSNGCTGTSNMLVGMEVFPGLSSLSVSPNPSTGYFILNGNATERILAQLSIMDLSGKKILNIPDLELSGSFRYPLDISQFSAGIYSLRIVSQFGTLVKELIISK